MKPYITLCTSLLAILMVIGCRHNYINCVDVSDEAPYCDHIGKVYSLPNDSYMISDQQENRELQWLTCSKMLFGEKLSNIDRSLIGRSFRELKVIDFFPKGTPFKLTSIEIRHSRVQGLYGESEMFYGEIEEYTNVLIEPELMGLDPFAYSILEMN